MTWTVFGMRAKYVIYIDGVATAETTSRYGTADRKEGWKGFKPSAAGVAQKEMAAHPNAKLCQIVKEYPVQSHKDHVIRTWRNNGKGWKIVLRHKEQAA